jgi:hypothetical protein
VLGDDRLGAAIVQVGRERIAVEGLVGDQATKGDVFDERRHSHAVVAMARQRRKAHEIAQRIGECEALGGQTALGAADGLAPCPPFAPCPWRWTLTMVPSIIANSRSGSSEQASNSRWNTSPFTQPR